MANASPRKLNVFPGNTTNKGGSGQNIAGKNFPRVGFGKMTPVVGAPKHFPAKRKVVSPKATAVRKTPSYTKKVKVTAKATNNLKKVR